MKITRSDHIDGLSGHDPGRHDMNKRQIHPSELAISHGSTTELLEFVEEPLGFLLRTSRYCQGLKFRDSFRLQNHK